MAGGIRSYSTTPANNNASPPFGWPEGQPPSSVNNAARQMMADIRAGFEDLPWFDFGDVPTRVDNDTITVPTDLTARYVAGRRIKFVGATTGYATISSASYSAPDTTINVTMDSGNVPTSLVTVSLGPEISTGAAVPYFARTSAEIAAGVTPTNYVYAPGDVRRYASLADWAAVGGYLTLDGTTRNIAAEIQFPAGSQVQGVPGSVINATGLNYHLFRALGSFDIRGVQFTRANAATNTSFKAVHADDTIAPLASGTRIVMRDCITTGFDIPIYVDGGTSHHIDYAEVSTCKHTINTLGTGGITSVRPTVNLNNCNKVEIRSNSLDASDVVNAVNNIYCIGSSVVTVEDNDLINGEQIKILSISGWPVEKLSIVKNRIKSGIVGILCNADTAPIRHVLIDGNTFDGQSPGAGDVGALIFAATLGAVAGDAIETVQIANNKFKGIGRSVVYLNMVAGQQFGSLLLYNNHYFGASAAASGTFACINQVGTGAYRTMVASNEYVEGNGVTRSYTQNALVFTNQQFLNVVETGLNGTPNGLLRVPLRRLDVTYSASMTIDATTANYFPINANNGTAFTINAPTNAVDGQRITVKIKNTSGVALGAATWNAVFKMAAWVNPANGFSASIDFEYDGTNWVEITRGGVTVPN